MTSEPHLPPQATPPLAFVAAPRPTASVVIGLGLLVFVLVVVQLIDGWQDGVSQALSTR